MTRLVTAEIPTSAAKIRALKLGLEKILFLPFLFTSRLRCCSGSRTVLSNDPGGPVAHARDGLDDPGLRWVLFDLAPQSADVDIDIAACQVMLAG